MRLKRGFWHNALFCKKWDLISALRIWLPWTTAIDRNHYHHMPCPSQHCARLSLAIYNALWTPFIYLIFYSLQFLVILQWPRLACWLLACLLQYFDSATSAPVDILQSFGNFTVSQVVMPPASSCFELPFSLCLISGPRSFFLANCTFRSGPRPSINDYSNEILPFF